MKMPPPHCQKPSPAESLPKGPAIVTVQGPCPPPSLAPQDQHIRLRVSQQVKKQEETMQKS